MRLLWLFLRSRLTGTALACLALVAAGTGAAFALTGGRFVALLLLAIAPLGVAAVVGASVRSPSPEVERTAPFPLPVLRLAHVIGLLAGGAVALALVGAVEPKASDAWTLARNALGYGGLALVGARLAGAGVAWIPPVAYAGGVYVAVIYATDVRLPPPMWWAWPMQAGPDGSAAVLALGALAAGLLAAAGGARSVPGEIE